MKPTDCPYVVDWFPEDLLMGVRDRTAKAGLSPDEVIIAAVRESIAHH